MENKLDVLTKKLYEEGIGKANQEAEKIIAEAKAKAEADAKAKEPKAPTTEELLTEIRDLLKAQQDKE